MVDLSCDARVPTRERLHRLSEELAPVARRLGGAGAVRALDHAAALIEQGGAGRQRTVARHGGARAVALWLAERFCVPEGG